MNGSSTSDRCRSLADELDRAARCIGRPVQIMEVCGTHTVSVFRHGLRAMLPFNVRLVSGPGCPVCVTPQGYIDAALALAGHPDVLICTYGDMLRVPGASGSLEMQRAAGAGVRVVNSARSALRIAAENPGKQVVFLAVGFETTAPATAAVILEAEGSGRSNFTVFSAHKRVLPAMIALLKRDDTALDGFLCPGHVSVVIGADAYEPVVDQFHVPCVVSGFEPDNILTALARLVTQIEHHEARVENVYPAAVTAKGNSVALRLMNRVFEVVGSRWRALGEIPESGFAIREDFAEYDAARRFSVQVGADKDHPQCRCGDVICGVAAPTDCALFGYACTPLNPYGPCMVSGEGTCSAHFKYGGWHASKSHSGRRERRNPVGARCGEQS